MEVAMKSETSLPVDPFHLWRAQSEAYWENCAKQWTALTNSEAGAKALTMLINSYLVATAPWQKVQEKLLIHLLQQCHLPTQFDLNRLANRLTRLEHKIDAIDAKLPIATPPKRKTRKRSPSQP
jgi:hypothetical protein